LAIDSVRVIMMEKGNKKRSIWPDSLSVMPFDHVICLSLQYNKVIQHRRDWIASLTWRVALNPPWPRVTGVKGQGQKSRQFSATARGTKTTSTTLTTSLYCRL